MLNYNNCLWWRCHLVLIFIILENEWIKVIFHFFFTIQRGEVLLLPHPVFPHIDLYLVHASLPTGRLDWSGCNNSHSGRTGSCWKSLLLKWHLDNEAWQLWYVHHVLRYFLQLTFIVYWGWERPDTVSTNNFTCNFHDPI